MRPKSSLFASLSTRVLVSFLIIVTLSVLASGLLTYSILKHLAIQYGLTRMELLLKEAERILTEEYFDYWLSESMPEILVVQKKESLQRLNYLFTKNHIRYVIYEGSKIIKANVDPKELENKNKYFQQQILFAPFNWKVSIALSEKDLLSFSKKEMIKYFSFLLGLSSSGLLLAVLTYLFFILKPLQQISLQLYSKDSKDGTVQKELSPIGIKEFDKLIERINQSLKRERELMEQMAFSEKMASVGTLAGGYAHEFNNLLQVLVGQLNLVRSKLEKMQISEAIKEKLSIAEDTALKGAELSRRLLILARPEFSAKKRVSIKRLIKELQLLLKSSIPKSIILQARIEEDLPPISISEGEMREILLNLCINARDAMKEKGVLTLVAYYLPKTQEVCIRVIDTGCGIDEETQKRIFDPFFTTKPPGQGTGLGLYMVYQLVNKARGKIELESLPGKGTKFSLLFPACLPESQEKEDLKESLLYKQDLKDIKIKRRVFLLEDENLIRNALKELLKKYGFEVVEAQTAEEGLQIFKRNNYSFSFMVIDLIMPGKGGIWFIKTLDKQGFSLPPIIVITGFAGRAFPFIEEMKNKNLIKAILRKPFSIKDLEKTILKILS